MVSKGSLLKVPEIKLLTQITLLEILLIPHEKTTALKEFDERQNLQMTWPIVTNEI